MCRDTFDTISKLYWCEFDYHCLLEESIDNFELDIMAKLESLLIQNRPKIVAIADLKKHLLKLHAIDQIWFDHNIRFLDKIYFWS